MAVECHRTSQALVDKEEELKVSVNSVFLVGTVIDLLLFQLPASSGFCTFARWGIWWEWVV